MGCRVILGVKCGNRFCKNQLKNEKKLLCDYCTDSLPRALKIRFEVGRINPAIDVKWLKVVRELSEYFNRQERKKQQLYEQGR